MLKLKFGIVIVDPKKIMWYIFDLLAGLIGGIELMTCPKCNIKLQF